MVEAGRQLPGVPKIWTSYGPQMLLQSRATPAPPPHQPAGSGTALPARRRARPEPPLARAAAVPPGQPQDGSVCLVHMRLRWPLPEVLVDAAPGRGDDYIMPDLAHDTRHVSGGRSAPMIHIGRLWLMAL